MASKSDFYLKKAEEFEAKGQAAQDPSVKHSYFELARNYRQLAAHVAESGRDKSTDQDSPSSS